MSTNVLTIPEASALRAILRRELPPAPPTPAEADIGAGDVVQIRPFADQTFGGTLLVVTTAAPHELRGYPLRPHRGGCRDAWLRLKHREVERVGRGNWPAAEAPFAARCEDGASPRPTDRRRPGGRRRSPQPAPRRSPRAKKARA
jgi:hypothetical protein